MSFENHRLPLPVHSYIVLMSPTQPIAQTRSRVGAGSNKWQLSDKMSKLYATLKKKVPNHKTSVWAADPIPSSNDVWRLFNAHICGLQLVQSLDCNIQHDTTNTKAVPSCTLPKQSTNRHWQTQHRKKEWMCLPLLHVAPNQAHNVLPIKKVKT